VGILGRLRHAVFILALTICFSEIAQPQEDIVLSLSPATHTSFYPEVLCDHCIVPTWDQHYLLHLEIAKDPSLVTMYDRDGKKVLEGRVTLQGASRISLRAAGATQGGQIVAAGGAMMGDGSNQYFIAEIGATGHTVQAIQLGDFSPQQVCTASDGTVWVLGYNQGSNDSAEDSAEADTNILRHYDFANGLLGGYVSLRSLSAARDAVLLVESPHESSLSCEKDRVSLLFLSASRSVAQYVVVNTSSQEVSRWSVIAPFAEAKANGFAVTDDGEVFVSLTGWSDSESTMRHGLYKLQAPTGKAAVTLIPVGGTVTAVKCHDCGNALPDGTFLKLYGADGHELVVRRTGDGSGLAWTKVSMSVSRRPPQRSEILSESRF
jgi:hypothetical protein